VVDGLTVSAALIGGTAVAVATGPSAVRYRLAAIAPRSGGAGPAADRSEAPGSGRPVSPVSLGAGHRSGFSSRTARLAAGGVAGLGVGMVLDGVLGVVAGCLVGGILVRWLGRLEPAVRARETVRVQATLPLAADLLSAAIAAGTPPHRAAHLVGAAVGGPLGALLVMGADRAVLGGDPTTAWFELARRAVTAPLARTLVTSAERGTAPAEALGRVAADARDTARWSAESRARALGARAAAPLGLCFLPAFLLVGVVPVVAAAGSLLP
jgi:Flp pilus assembly protein TadB